MTKAIVFIFIILCAKILYAKEHKERSLAYHRQGKNFVALVHALEQLKNQKSIDMQYSVILDEIIQSTGTESISWLPSKSLKLINTTTTDLLLGKRYLEQGKQELAKKYLKKIPLTHKYRAEAMLYMATIELLSGNTKKADKDYFSCEVLADDLQRNEESALSKRYYDIIADRCSMNRARILFQNDLYEDALKQYENIEKTSFLWPYTLSEKAWAHYKNNDFNRALGTIVTYKAPLLSSYFTPEGELILALSYMGLCQWKDAQTVVNNYYKKFQPISEKILKTMKSSSFEAIITAINTWELSKLDPIFRNIATQLSKRIKYNLLGSSIKRLEQEISNTKKNQDLDLLKKLKIRLENNRNQMTKKFIVDYINKIHDLSKQMFNINIEILASKREEIYHTKPVANNRSRGEEKFLKVKKNQNFYQFIGEFWADELGDYSFGLESKCI